MIKGFEMKTESAIYIKDGHLPSGESVDFIGAILDGVKKGETRRHKSLTRKWVGIVKGDRVVGRVRFGEPVAIDEHSPQYRDAMIEGTEYDVRPGKAVYYYPVLEVMDFRDSPKPVVAHGHYAKYERSF